jgi:prevent-host-death family protein
MPKEYSIYDAKAKLSALVREVREQGRSFYITVHGEPVAELRPIEAPPHPQTLAERIAELEALGAIGPSTRPAGQKPKFPIGTYVPGALQRFLDDRE